MAKKRAKGMTYAKAGVDISVAEEAKERLKKHVRTTFNKNVALDVGQFGGAFSANFLKSYKHPILVSSIDGVGTKAKVAQMMNKWDSIGIDLVNHSCNDILCIGGKPLFFLDYIACNKIDPSIVEQLVKGMAVAARENGLAIVGGETAQMPGVYAEGEYDLAGCIIGVAEKSDLIDGKGIKAGDVLIGLASNGLHTNGYSLARKVLFDKAGYTPRTHLKELGTTVGNALLVPHKNYSKAILALRKKFKVKGIAHITGGGFQDNLPRVLPKGLGAKIYLDSFRVPPLFRLIQRLGVVPDSDMFHTFNMGIGLVLVVPNQGKEKALRMLNTVLGEKARLIGEVVKGPGVKLARFRDSSVPQL